MVQNECECVGCVFILTFSSSGILVTQTFGFKLVQTTETPYSCLIILLAHKYMNVSTVVDKKFFFKR